MITDLNYVAGEDVLISYTKDGSPRVLNYQSISNIWPELTPDTIEGGRAKAYDNKIIFTALIASGQGGYLFVFDTVNEIVLYAVENAYCVDFLLIDHLVITLHAIWNYVTPFHFQVYVHSLGDTYSQETPLRVYCEIPQKTLSQTPEDSYLLLEGEQLFVVVGSGKHLFSSNVKSIQKQEPNPEYSILYQTWKCQMDPKKRVLLNMLT